jgi:hypothetical protein
VWQWLLAGGIALLGAVVDPASTSAHILFDNDDPNDVLADLVLSFVIPVAVLGVGALIGMLVARYLGRGDAPEVVESDATEVPPDQVSDPLLPVDHADSPGASIRPVQR